MIKRWLAVMVAACAMLSPGCDSADVDDGGSTPVAILVANQGNFTDGNGSVTRFDPESGEVATLVSQPGSIIQSLAVRADLVYVAMNTGDRIDVVHLDRGLVGQIVDVPSPRYLAWADDGRMIISSLYDNSVSIVDPASETVVATVDVGANPEGVLVDGSMAFVANHGFGAGSSLSVVDLDSREVVKTFQLDCDGPRFAFMDRQRDLWVVCTGQTLYDSEFNVTGTTDGAVLVVDPTTGSTRSRFDLEGMVSTPGPGQDAFYSDEAELLFVVLQGETILRFDTAANSPVGAIGPLSGSPIGAVAYDAQDERLYVGRVPGFSTAGRVSILDSQGVQVGEFAAGVAPSHIGILREVAVE